MRTLRDLISTFPDRGDALAWLAYGEDGAERWTYAQAWLTIDALAHRLAEEGVQPGERIAILAGGRPAWFGAALATIHAGAVAVPIDAQLADDEVERILRDSGATRAFVDERQAGRVERMAFAEDRAAGDRVIRLDDAWGAAHAEAGEQREVRELPELSPGDPAVLFYTSGTTGPAKGVPLTHRNLAFQVDTIRKEELLEPTDRLLLALPTHHVYPFVIGILVPASYGIPVILPASRSGPELVRALDEGDVTALLGVPRLYRALVDALEDRVASGSGLVKRGLRAALAGSFQLARAGLSRGKLFFRPLHRRFGPELRLMASGGAPLDADLERRLTGLGWQIAIGYGLTETSPLLTMRRPGEIAPGTVGRPIAGVDLRIDPDRAPEGHPGPEDAGEVQAKGPGVFSGYHGLPDATKATFTEDGWFRTGDLGYLDDDGRLVLLGRVSTLIVTESGENVQPTAVEEHYAEHRAIREVGVLERGGKLAALVVPEPRELLADEKPATAAREAIEERSEGLPSYQRASEVAITSEPLPRTRLGDLRRHLLAERFETAVSDEAGEQHGPVDPADMSPQDRRLLEAPAARETWELLVERFPDRRLTPDTSPRVGLGIDSLAWVDLTLEIERRTGVRLPEDAVQEIASVRDLLQAVAAEEPAGEADAASPLAEPDSALDEDEEAWLEPHAPWLRALSDGAFWVVDHTMRIVFRLRVDGAEHLPDAPAIVTPNHVSYLDPFAVAAALPTDVRRNTMWAGSRDVMFGNALMRAAARIAWTVPVEPGRAATSSLALGAAALERGRNVVWFPEGRRSPDASLRPFTPGIGKLLDATGAWAVPTHLDGPERALPVGAFWPRPTVQIRVRFGRAADADTLAAEGEGASREERIADGLRMRVQALATTAREAGATQR